MAGRDEFLERGAFILGDRKDIHFWEDTWLGETLLSSQYHALYNLVSHKHVRVADVLSSTRLNIGFRRVLQDDKWDSWLNLVQQLMSVQLTNEPDRFKWRLTTSGFFSSEIFVC
jgi:hypothetical protein